MIDNPRFRGMTLPQARELEEESRGFRDLSDEQVWALRMVHAHDCTQRPAEPTPDPRPCDTNRYGLPVYAGDGWTVEGEPDGEVAVTIADDAHPGSAARYVFEPEIVAAIAALAERPAERDRDALTEFARWLVAMDDPTNTEAMRERQTVTLSAIIERARTALAERPAKTDAPLHERSRAIPAEPDDATTATPIDLGPAVTATRRHALAERPAEPADPDGYELADEDEQDVQYALTLARHLAEGSGATERTKDGLIQILATEVQRLREIRRDTAKPQPAPDLVAAFMAEPVIGSRSRSVARPTPDEAERMAAVAQARIDAAIDAERDRVREALARLRDDATPESVYAEAMRDAIAVVDRDTGGQR